MDALSATQKLKNINTANWWTYTTLWRTKENGKYKNQYYWQNKHWVQWTHKSPGHQRGPNVKK